MAKVEGAEAKFAFQRRKKTLYVFSTGFILQFKHSSMFSNFNLVHIVLF